MRRLSFIIIASGLMLGGCSTFGSDVGKSTSAGAELPAMPEYTKDFRREFADEIDVVCGNHEKNIKEHYPYTCIFVQDAITLRAQLKAIKKLD